MNRVLVVSHATPHFPGPGSETRVFCLAEQLSREFDIEFLLPDYGEGNREQVEALRSRFSVETFRAKPETGHWNRLHWTWFRWRRRLEGWGRHLSATPQMVHQLRLIFPGLIAALERVRWERYDLVHFVHPESAVVLGKVSVPLPKTLDWVDERTTVLRRQEKGTSWSQGQPILELWRVERFQRWVARQFDAGFVSSDVDAERLGRRTGVRPVVVDNAVRLEYFTNRSAERPDSNDIVFTGQMSYEPNVDAVRYFSEEILPLILRDVPDGRFYIVGMQPAPEVRAIAERLGESVIVTGEVADVRPYLCRSKVSVVPLRNGGGTRLKVLEAMAMRRPVVSTRIGCEGLMVEEGKHLLIGENPSNFAAAVVSLLKDGERWQRFAENGRKLVEERYGWRKSAERIAEVWRALIEKDVQGVTSG